MNNVITIKAVSFDVAFAALQRTAFIPVDGDWIVCLEDKVQRDLATALERPDSDGHTVSLEPEFFTPTYHAALYKRGDKSNPTWHGPSMDPFQHRYYQIDSKNPDATDYMPVSDPKVAMDPSDPKTVAAMSLMEDGSWIITTMRPQVIISLGELAQLISRRVSLEMFLYYTNRRTHFTVKETLETVHALDIAMRVEFGVGPAQRAARMRIEG